MRIRWKLLLLLLSISLVPLIVIAALDHREMRGLGRELGGRAREGMIEIARQQLQQIVDDRSEVIWQAGQRIVQTVQSQTRETEACLAGPVPTEARVFHTRDYKEGPNLPSGRVVLPRYAQVDERGIRRPLPVTFEEQVFNLAPGTDAERVAGDILRLSAMLPAYRSTGTVNRELLLWQCVSLENGVHACYPGHGSYPPEYDHRTRDWYRRTKEAGRLEFSAPYVDVATGEVIITVGMPIRRPDGSFAGVASADFLISDIVSRVHLPPYASSDAKVMMVAVLPDVAGGGEGLKVVAEPEYLLRKERWDRPFEAEWLTSDDADEFREMVRELIGGRSGVRPLRYRGRPCLWAYRLFDGHGGGLVVIVPYEDIVAEATRAEAHVLGRTSARLRTTGGIVLAALGAIIGLSVLISRTVTRPIRELAAAAGRIAQGDLDVRVRFRRRDELGDLGRAFNEMMPQLRDRMRMRHALSIAMEVQQRLLPAGPPKVAGLDVFGRSIYCDETGGDYYDFLDLSRLGPRQLGVAVGDVAGHGIAAALLMATARALLRSHAARPGSLSELMTEMNLHLVADTPADRFMTLFYAVLDARTRTVRWVSAGHDPAMLYRPHDDAFDALEGRDIPLGIQPGWQFQECGPRSLTPDDILLIGTDGIWEAQDPSGRLFGKDALQDVIRRHAAGTAREIGRAVTAELAAFRGTHPQEDDVTLVVVKVLEDPPGEMASTG